MISDGYYCPLFSSKSLKRGLTTGRAQYAEGELEMRCTRCLEWWPADTEFFYASEVGLHSMCCACYREYRTAKKAA